MSFKTITGSTKGQLIKGIPPVGGGGGGGTVNSVISSDNTLTIANGAGPIVDTSVSPVVIDIGTAQNMILVAGVIANRWYLITESTQVTNESDTILIQGVEAEQFAEYAVLVDRVSGINNVIKFDVTRDLMVYREDNKGNKVFNSAGVNASTFDWNNDNVTNNTFINSVMTGVNGTNNIVKNNTFHHAELILSDTDCNIQHNTVGEGTLLTIDQNGLNMTYNDIRAVAFRFDAGSFMTTFSHNKIITSGLFSNAGGESRDMSFCDIQTSEDISTITILNSSLYLLTNKIRNNNIFGTLDMTDASQFVAGTTLAPAFSACPFAGNFILSGGSGASISNVSIGNDQSVRFYAGNGSTYTFTYVAIATVTTSGQSVASSLTSDVIVGRTHALDFIEFEMGLMGDAAAVKTNVVKLV